MPSATAALVPLTASSSASLRDFISDAGALTVELMAQTATLVDGRGASGPRDFFGNAGGLHGG